MQFPLQFLRRAAKPSATRGRGLGDRYLVGAAYYPEWWPSSEWEIDFREMRELGINAVRMGEFAWAQFEPSPGKFDFDWMDRALDDCGPQWHRGRDGNADGVRFLRGFISSIPMS